MVAAEWERGHRGVATQRCNGDGHARTEKWLPWLPREPNDRASKEAMAMIVRVKELPVVVTWVLRSHLVEDQQWRTRRH